MTITLNLFDGNFRHSPFSTAFQTTDSIEWVRDKKEWDGITVFTDGYILERTFQFSDVKDVKTRYAVGWLHEPACLWPQLYEKVTNPEVYNQFNYILTYYQPLLDHPSGKFRFSPYGGVWIPKSEWGLRPKTKRISMLYGTKKTTRGHQIRHEVAETLGDKYGIDYYGARGTPTTYGWQTKLQVLKDYQFSIVCETCRDDNLFTEILLDCFAVGTIPIFWGCPNISNYFERMGVLSFENIYQLESLLRELDEHTYTYLQPFARENLRRVAEYRITEEWLYGHVFSEVMA